MTVLNWSFTRALLGKVPALWYDAPKDADPSSPPAGTFILPESSLIVNFVESVYPELQCRFFLEPICLEIRSRTDCIVLHSQGSHQARTVSLDGSPMGEHGELRMVQVHYVRWRKG
jgi:hypothetical protein